jgi:hypothetical protein
MRYLFLFAGQGINYLIAVINIRAASRGKLWFTSSTDFLFCVVNFLLIQHIAIAGSLRDLLAYAAGGAAGSTLAILLTRRWDR